MFGINYERKIDELRLKFETDVDKLLGDRIRASDKDAEAMWSALANVSWFHDGREISYSFRSGAGFIADAIRHSGDYMDWYLCSDEVAVVAPWIAEAMASVGWTYKLD